MNRSQCLKQTIIAEIIETFNKANVDEIKLKHNINWICGIYDEIFETSIISIGIDSFDEIVFFTNSSFVSSFELEVLNVEILEEILLQLSK